MRRFPLLACVLVCAACGSTPAAPTPPVPVVPACQANSTADVSFANRSSSTTQDVFWDGQKAITLVPGQTSGARAVAAGVAHRHEVRITNTSFLACTASSPIPAVCSTPIYTCAFP